jgi:hypothetical protein
MDVVCPNWKSNIALSHATLGAQLSHLAQHVTCKLAKSYVERDAIFKLRYQSYLRGGLISQNAFGRYIETCDHAPNAYLLGLHVNRQLVGSLRLQIGSRQNQHFSALELFPHVLERLPEGSHTVVDLSCVAADGGASRLYRCLPYLTLRAWILAAEYFQAEYIVAVIRPAHMPFYQRALGCELQRDLRRHPHPASVGLVTFNFAASAGRLYNNLPFLHSTSLERQRLFDHDEPAMAARPPFGSILSS